MKKIFAVTVLLMSLASIALADGAGNAPPPKSINPHKTLVADGAGGAPPPIKHVKPASFLA
jgi:hypothetical protein